MPEPFAAARQQQQRIADAARPPRAAAAAARRPGAPRAAGRKLVLDPLRQIAGAAGRPKPPASCVGVRPSRQLEQRQRVAARLGDDPVADPPVQREAHRRVEQRAGVAVDAAPRTSSSGRCRSSSPGSRAANTSAHRLGQQPARDERERQRRGPIEPLRVVDDAQQRTLLGHLGQQAEHGQADQEAIRARPGAQAEHGPQRVALRRRQPRRAGRAAARTAGAGPRTPAPSRTPRPTARTTVRSGADSDQVLEQRRLARSRPRRAGPATGSRPRRTSSIRSSSRAHSSARPRRLTRAKPSRIGARVASRAPDQWVGQGHTGATGARAEGGSAASPNTRTQWKEILMSSPRRKAPAPSPARPTSPRGSRDTFTSRYVDTGDLRLHAVIGGEGPPLLLVHGWPETWYAWRLLMPALARDFEVIAVDQRGIGLSDKPAGGYDTGTLADDLVALMDALGHERFARRRPRHRLRDQLRARRGPPGAGRPRGPRRDPRLPRGGALTAACSCPRRINDRLWHIPFNRLERINEQLVTGREAHLLRLGVRRGRRGSCPDEVIDYYVRMLSEPDVLTRQLRVVPRARRDDRAGRAAQGRGGWRCPCSRSAERRASATTSRRRCSSSPTTCRASSSPAPATGSPRRRPTRCWRR